MKLKKFATGVFAMAAVAAALIFTGGTSVTAKAAVNTKSDIEIAAHVCKNLFQKCKSDWFLSCRYRKWEYDACPV